MNTKATLLVLVMGISSRCLAEEGSNGATQSPAQGTSVYSPVGKRDPFKPPNDNLDRDIATVSPLERFSLEQFQLRAILKGFGKNRAMFQDPEGKVHILSEGDVVGRGRATVSRILNTEVIMTERTFNYLGQESLFEKVVSLPGDSDSLTKNEKQTSKEESARSITEVPGTPSLENLGLGQQGAGIPGAGTGAAVPDISGILPQQGDIK